MTRVRVMGDEAQTDPLGPAEPDWRHDPRELADSVQRRATRRRRSRVGAVVAAVLLVVGGGWYLGFVTGWVAVPGLGTLTDQPAGVSTFTVGDTYYLMQVDAQDEKTVVVSRQIGKDSPQRVAGLPVPATDTDTHTESVTALRIAPSNAYTVRSTYVAVLPAGARDVLPTPNDPQSSMTVYEGAVRTSPAGSTLMGVVVTVDPPGGAPSALWLSGLAGVRWTDADGHQHVSAVTP